jgi:diacylglycerol kinase family enzyme
LIFGNIASFGGTFQLSPTASPVSGKLDCIIFNCNSLANVAMVSLDFKRRKQLESDKAQVFQGENFKLYARKPLEFQLDGEIIEMDKEVEISVQPKALTMIIADRFLKKALPLENEIIR